LNLYVSDEIGNRIERFDSAGTFIGWMGACTGPGTGGAGASQCVGTAPDLHSNGFNCKEATCAGPGTAGTGDGQFNGPEEVVVDASGNMWVAEGINARVQEFNNAGAYVTQVGCSTNNPSPPACSFSSNNGAFTDPEGIAVDASGNLYVGDGSNGRVEKFNSAGIYVSQLGCSTGDCCPSCSNSGMGQFGNEITGMGIALGPSGNVYVADTANNRVEEFGVAISQLSGFTGDAAGSVLLIIGDTDVNGLTHGTKPSGVGYQQGRDTTPLGFISGMLTNKQTYSYDDNPNFVGSNGRPTTTLVYPLIFVFGNGINAVEYYYEDTAPLSSSTVAEEAPLFLTELGGNYIWSNRAGTTVATVSASSDGIPPGNSDTFVIETLTDTSGRMVVFFWGITYLGTWAAAYYFEYTIYPSISAYTNSYYVVQWTDAAFGAAKDGIPDQGDTFHIIAQG
jgi:hypothetical protein